MKISPEMVQKPANVRMLARTGELTGTTAGMARGHVQGNVVILPASVASDFLLYCQRNPKPCPVLAVSDPGDPHLPSLGDDIDIRTDVPRYRVFRNGELCERPTDLKSVWRDDLVTFVLGCSFSFEEALAEDGIPLRHVERQVTVPMYRTRVQTQGAGRFHGELVVSMRPMLPAQAIRAIQITSRFTRVHGAPVHFGDPNLIGVGELDKPDFGDRVDIKNGEMPVFWACGVTPQVAIRNAQPELAITHDPGRMLVADKVNASLAID